MSENRAGRAGPSPGAALTAAGYEAETAWSDIHLKCFLIFHFRKCDVLNRGFSGYNTRWAKIILPRLIRKGNALDSPVAVTIFFGANDSALKGKGVFVFPGSLSRYSKRTRMFWLLIPEGSESLLPSVPVPVTGCSRRCARGRLFPPGGLAEGEQRRQHSPGAAGA